METWSSVFEWPEDSLPQAAIPYVAVVIDREPASAAAIARAVRDRGWHVSRCTGTSSEISESVDPDVDLVIVATTGHDWSIDAHIVRELRPVLSVRTLVVLVATALAEHAGARLLDAGYDDVLLAGAAENSLAVHLGVIAWRLEKQRRGHGVDAALQASMLTLDEFVEHLPCGAYESTPSGRFLRVNQAMVDLLGYASKGDLLATDIPRDLYRDPCAREGFLAAIDASNVAAGHELHFRRKGGDEIVLLDHAFARRDAAGRVVSYVGTLTDITGRTRDLRRAHDRAEDLDSRIRHRTAELVQANVELRSRAEQAERAQQRLQQSEERFRRLIEDLSDGIFQLDPDGRVTYASPGLIQMLGIDDPAHGNRTIVDFVHPDDLTDRVHHLQQLQRGERVTSEFRLVAHDGRARHVMCTTSPLIKDGRCTKIQGVVTDVTEIRDLEARVRRAETLEAMGRLAGAVAHDFNNLIMVVLGATHLLSQRCTADSEAHGELEMITRSARSAADLSRSLLAFSRRQMLHREVLSVDAVIAAALPLVDRMVGDAVELRHIRAVADIPILADQASIERILVNLCLNARDAMPGGGRIEVECQRVDVDETTAKSSPWMRPGVYVRLTVRDTGTGMDKATVQRVLDPFFTTKDADKGTGLGLTSVYGTAKQHGGFIAIDSEPGVGTEVSVFLPCTDVGAAPPVSEHGDEATAGKLTVLVAEDRRDLLEIMCRFLEDLGHTVKSATNGGDALAMLEASDGGIDVVVTDVAMPVMGGLELRAICHARWPHIAFVLCSGYREGSGDSQPSDELTVLLEKPFDVGDLDRRISQVIKAARRWAGTPAVPIPPPLESEDLA